MTKIQYVIGDATDPIGDGHKIIAHVVNDQGGWGAGFVMALSRMSRLPEIDYRAWSAGDYALNDYPPPKFGLGEIQMVPIREGLEVVNMIAQHKFVSPQNPVALRYNALEDCLEQLSENATMTGNVSIHMPRIGCGLAGGDWNVVEDIINHTLTRHGIEVYVYDLEEK